MKKITLLLMVCMMSLMAFAQGGNITYNLNGGVFNDDGWQSKADMLVAFNQDYNAFYSVPESFGYYTWETLDEILTYPDPVLRIATYTDAAASIGRPAGLMHGLLMTEKWQWLHDYIVATVADQGIAAIAEDESAHAYWRYNTSAFFISGQRTSWPASANYAAAGQPEAFMPAWEHAFAGPATYDGTKEVILPIPFHADEPFVGWFDNAACTGFPITAIPAGSSGDKTFYAKYGEPDGTAWNITYELNEGVTNDDGWQDKADMLVGLNQDYNTFYSVPESYTYYTWETLDEILTYPDPVLRIATYTDAAAAIGRPAGLMHGLLMTEKWQWLHDYIVATVAAQSIAAIAEDESAHAYWRYNVSAFFVSGQRTSWPASANYAAAGQPAAFIPAWEHAFAGPATYDGSAEIVLPDPYKEGFTFAGWYATADFSGNKLTSIPFGTSGDLKLYAKWIDYVSTCAEVWALPAGSTTYAAGVVTHIDGTTVHIQDATAGLLVEFAAAPAIARGDQIIIEGTTAALGEYVKVTAAKLEGKEAATLPATQKITLTALGANIFKYVSLEGLSITDYSGGNAILSDGPNTIMLAAGISEAKFPVKTKVNVKAVVSYVGGDFLLVGVADDVEVAPLAGVDPFDYPALEDGKYTLKSKWLFSNVLDNFSANRPGAVESTRGMIAKDGKMYFINSHLEQLIVVDGATGEMLTPIQLEAQIFATCTRPVGGLYPLNDLQHDHAGNVLVSNGIATNAGHFQVWKIDLATGNGAVVIDEELAANPDYADMAIRFDAFGVYGDVNGNAIIMAANASGMNAFKWTISGGVAGGAELIEIDISEEGTYLTGLENPGTAPRIFPMDENYFYLDGNATLPTLIDMDGNVVDGFYPNAGVSDETVQEWFGARGNAVGHNGLLEFELAGEHFFLMASGNTLSAPPSTFHLFKWKDANKEFKDIQSLWRLPNAGMGGASNTYRSAVPSVEVNEATKTANLYLYTGENGYGVYEFKIDGGNSIKVVKGDAIQMLVLGNRIQLSENAKSIKVFNLVGQLAQTAQGTSSINIANKGIYIVAVQTLKGETVTKKVIIR